MKIKSIRFVFSSFYPSLYTTVIYKKTAKFRYPFKSDKCHFYKKGQQGAVYFAFDFTLNPFI